MPLLTKIVTEDGRQIGTLEDGSRVLLSNPFPCFSSQSASKRVNEKMLHLGDELRKQAREDKTSYYQIGAYTSTPPLEIITYITWDGSPVK